MSMPGSSEISLAAPPQTISGLAEAAWYWLGLPWRWGYHAAHNSYDIARVLDLIRFRPLPAGLIGLDHPWVTGIHSETGKPIWSENVIYRSPRKSPQDCQEEDDAILMANGKFLAERVRQSAITPELPLGPKRRMPHAINYIHGSSHYNSGVILLNDLEDGFRHSTDPRFRRELLRFVRQEKREVLFLFRDRHYDPLQFAYLSCCMRTLYAWFCNPNGPRGRVLWGNSAPFPAANLITSYWARDLYTLKRPGGAEAVIRPPIRAAYFQEGPYENGRPGAIWPEKLLAWSSYWRIKLRRGKGGMFFVDRRRVYEDQIKSRRARGLSDEERASFY